MTRRTFAATFASVAAMPAAVPRTTMGVAETSFNASKPKDTIELLELANSLGAAGIQATLSSKEPAYLHKLRDRAGELGMYLETMVPFPVQAQQMASFEAGLAPSKQAGAVAVRIATDGGRRYEKWSTLEAWAAFLKETSFGVQAVARAAEAAKIPVGIENHKDYTIEELLGAMKRLGSDYFGVTLDFGNNITLLDPLNLVLELAPYAKLTHVKDNLLEPYPEGFLCGDVALGEGILEVAKIIAAVRGKQPATRFTLEMMTRDPLAVPCLTEGYWVTLPARSGRAVAYAMTLARKTAATHPPLARYSNFDPRSLSRVELENVTKCLYYARTTLGLV